MSTLGKSSPISRRPLVRRGTFGLAATCSEKPETSSAYVTCFPLGALATPSASSMSSTAATRRQPAASVSSRRTLAAAFRIAVPLSCIEWLPAVMPSSGVRAVSAVTSSIAAGETASSSAAIWIRAVRSPWPSSALPVKTVICPAASMRILESSCGYLARSPGSPSFLASWAKAAPLVAKATTNAPWPNSCRRESALTSGPPSRRRPSRRPRDARRPGCACGCRSGRGWAPCAGAAPSRSASWCVRAAPARA